MAVLAYLLPPVSGLIVFLSGRSDRARAHGLQAVALGLIVPLSIFVASLGSPRVTQAVTATLGVGWAALVILTALGRDRWLPGLGGLLERVARGEDSPG